MMRLRLVGAVCALAATLAAPAAGNPRNLTFVDPSGAHHALKDFQGKWVLVNYWATWCAACIEEMPALSALAAQEPELVIVGVTNEKLTPDQLQLFLTKHPVSYPMGRSDEAGIPRELSPSMLGVQVRPMSFLIAPDGTIAKRYVGAVDVQKLKLFIASHQGPRS